MEANSAAAEKLPPPKELPRGLPQDNYLPEFKNELADALADIVRQHEVIIECGHKLQKFCSALVLFKSFQMTFQFCNVMYTVFSVEATLSREIQ